jgi:hypothetical protein
MATTETKEKWLPLSHAAKAAGISMPKLYRMIRVFNLEVRRYPRDLKLRLVEINNLKRILGE